MHNLVLVYFVNLYMFREYLGPSSGVQPYVYNSWYLLFFLDSSPTRLTDSHLKRIISTNCCIQTVYAWLGPRYSRNVEVDEIYIYIYTKNKLCIKLVVLQVYIESHGQQNIKSKISVSEFWLGEQVFSSRTFLVRCILDIADETNSADGGENPDYGFLGCDTE